METEIAYKICYIVIYEVGLFMWKINAIHFSSLMKFLKMYLLVGVLVLTSKASSVQKE